MEEKVGASVEIIFVCYNNKDDIARCFSSLERTTAAYGKVILVDNNSQGSTVDEIENSRSILQKGEFLLHRNEVNLGFAAALNRGIHLSASPFLVFANLDIEFMEGWLPPLIKELRRDDVAFVGPKILDSRGRLNSCGIGGTERERFHRGWGKMDRGQFDRVEDVVSVSGALFASKREIFKVLGLFDENFFLYFEETEMHIRARRAGYSIVYTPHSRIVHYLGRSPKKRDDVRRWFRESEAYFNRKMGFE